MQIIKNFFSSIWDGIVILQTARAAEHMARCGLYKDAREIYLPSRCSK